MSEVVWYDQNDKREEFIDIRVESEFFQNENNPVSKK
jgi:hypothetical protein